MASSSWVSIGEVASNILKRDNMTIQSIPTELDGITYRSRTEARWALFFRDNGIPFVYEAEGFNLGGVNYLPDFLLTVGKCWFEVKPFDPTPVEINKAKRLAVATRKLVFIAPDGPKAQIGLFAISPTGRVLQDWKFAYAHDEGVGYICENLWNATLEVKIANVKNSSGMYGDIGPDDELEQAGRHHFPWSSAPDEFRSLGRRVVQTIPARKSPSVFAKKRGFWS